MSVPEFVSTVLAIPSIVGKAASADEAWTDLRIQAGERWESASEVLRSDLDYETELIVAQLREIFAGAPLQSNLQLLYFGLFSGANPVRIATRHRIESADVQQSLIRNRELSPAAQAVLAVQQ